MNYSRLDHERVHAFPLCRHLRASELNMMNVLNKYRAWLAYLFPLSAQDWRGAVVEVREDSNCRCCNQRGRHSSKGIL